MERIPIKTNPKLFDAVVAPIQRHLGEYLPWLDHIFGVCEVLTDVKNGNSFTSANVYKGKGQYEQIMPCKELGNFAFFFLRDPQRYDSTMQRISSPFSLVIWYDMRNVSPMVDERNREDIKAQILGVLNLLRGKFEIEDIYENPKNIFGEFSYDFKQNQCLMSPYAGLRIDGTLTARVDCYQRDFNNDFNEDFG